MVIRKVANVSINSGNCKHLLSLCNLILTTNRGVKKTAMHYGMIQKVSSAVYECHENVTSTLNNLDEVAEFMPQYTPCYAMYLPVALAVWYDYSVYITIV